MALSKYERRVLAEFEAELAQPRGRWHRVGAFLDGVRRRLWRLQGRARQFLVPVSLVLLSLAGCALEISCLPARTAEYTTTATALVAGLAGGVLAARLWRRYGPGAADPGSSGRGGHGHRSTTSGR
jgi:hypothetical protein